MFNLNVRIRIWGLLFLIHIFHDVIWPDPDPYPHKMIESGSDHKVWIRVDPDPQHCPPPLIISFICIIAGPQERVGARGPDPRE